MTNDKRKSNWKSTLAFFMFIAVYVYTIYIPSTDSVVNSTDWYVVRYGETGVLIPDDIKAKRAEARLIL